MTSKKDGCAVGSKLSLADIGIYYLAIFFFDDKAANKAAWVTFICFRTTMW